MQAHLYNITRHEADVRNLALVAASDGYRGLVTLNLAHRIELLHHVSLQTRPTGTNSRIKRTLTSQFIHTSILLLKMSTVVLWNTLARTDVLLQLEAIEIIAHTKRKQEKISRSGSIP